MPASKFTRKATTPKLKRQWNHVYQSALSRGASKSRAITMASGVVKRQASGRRKGKRKSSRS